jgi:hypothetical protein
MWEKLFIPVADEEEPMSPSEGGPTTRERAETVREVLEDLAAEGPQEGDRLRRRVDADDEAFEQAAQDLWKAGLVTYRFVVRSGTVRPVLDLSDDGRSLAT